MSDPRTNDRIRVPEVRLVGPAGEQVGVVRIEDALRLAQEADLDLVEVAPNSKPPVAKIMDFGKFKYETAQKAKEAKRNQSNTILKEVRFRLKIDVHDYETKRKRAEGFLKTGDKVKAMILFRGREQSRPEQGVRLLQRFAEDVAEFGTVESTPMIDGRNMVMVIGPLKTKAEVKGEVDAKRAASKPPRAERPAQPERQADDEAPVRRQAPAAAAPAAAPAAAAPVAEKKAAPASKPATAAPTTAAPATTAPAASTAKPATATRPATSATSARPAPTSATPAAKPASETPAAKPATATPAAKPATATPAAKPAAAAKPATPKAPAVPRAPGTPQPPKPTSSAPAKPGAK
nr:translation initiation factor IF-3 [Marisediminicola senii]